MTAWRESRLREVTERRKAEHSEFRLDPSTLNPGEWGELHIAYRKNHILKSGGIFKPLPYDKNSQHPVAIENSESELLSKLPQAMTEHPLFEDLNVDVMQS